MSAQLLANKLVDLIALLRKWGFRKSYKPRATVTCKKLHLACFVIPCGHTFLHHLIDLLKGGGGGGGQRFQPFVQLNKQCHLDIAWCQECVVGLLESRSKQQGEKHHFMKFSQL